MFRRFSIYCLLITVVSSTLFSQGYELALSKNAISEVECMAVGPDEKTLITGHLDGTVRIWDIASWTIIKTVKERSSNVNSIYFNPDGTLFVTAGVGDYLGIYQYPSGELLYSITVPSDNNSFAAFDGDGEYIYFGGFDRARVYDKLTDVKEPYSALYKVKVKDATSYKIAFSDEDPYKAPQSITDGNVDPNGEYVVFTRHDEVMFYSIKDQKLSFHVPVSGILNNLTPTANGLYLWGDRFMSLIEMEDGKYVVKKKVLAGSNDGTNGYSRMVLSANGNYLVTGDYANDVILWNAKTLDKIQRLAFHTDVCRTFSFILKDSILITGGYDKKIAIWKYNSRLNTEPEEVRYKSCYQLEDFAEFGSGFKVLVTSPDKRYIISGHMDGSIVIWNPYTLEVVNKINFHTGQINHLGFNVDGTQMISCGEDTKIALWSLPDLNMIKKFDSPLEWHSFAYVTADGNDIIYGGANTNRGNDDEFTYTPISYGALMKVNIKSRVNEVLFSDSTAYNYLSDADISYNNGFLCFANGANLYIYHWTIDRIQKIPFSFDIANLLLGEDCVYLWGANIPTKIVFDKDMGYKVISATGQFAERTYNYCDMAGSSRNDLVVTGGGAEKPIIWNANRMEVNQILLGHSTLVRCSQFYAKDSLLFTADAGGRLLVWTAGDINTCTQQYQNEIVTKANGIPLRIANKKVLFKNYAAGSNKCYLHIKSNLKQEISIYCNNECIFTGYPDDKEMKIELNNKETSLMFDTYCEKTDNPKKITLQITEGDKSKSFVLSSGFEETEAILITKE